MLPVMADPRDPRGEGRLEVALRPESGTGTRADDDTDPFIRGVAEWLTAFGRAMRGARVYAGNNEMHQKLVDRAFEGLNGLFDEVGELNLGVREDRILCGQEVVQHDSDRQDGLPFILYRNGFRRLTLLRGMSRDELLELIGALNADFGPFDFAGDDLVSTLWRLQLPHLRYVTIDTLAVNRSNASPQLDDVEVDRIQGDIEQIVAAIYRHASGDDDIVAAVTIGREDLEALREIRTESAEELDRLDTVTERAIAEIPQGQLQAVQAFLFADDREALTRRMLDILVRILFKEASGAASGATIELLQQLFDSLLLSQRYTDARGLIERLRGSLEHSEDMQEVHIAQQLLRMFATEARILPVLDAFNDGYRTVPLSDLLAFLRALGPSASPILLAGLDNLDSAAHRKLICDLIVEFGVPPVSLLEERSSEAKWFVARDILEIARHHPLERITRLVRDALHHAHPKVRAQAVRILRDYGPGAADELIAERLSDEDQEVRMVAARVAASRRNRAILPAFEALLKEEDLADRDLRELRVFLGAYATIGQGSSVRALGALLHPSFFARLKSPDLQVAAASALGLIPSENARAHLRRGARALSSKVREACRRALSQSQRGPLDLAGETTPQVAFSPPEEWASGSRSGPSSSGIFSASRSGTYAAARGMGGVDFSVEPERRPQTLEEHPMLRTGPALPVVDVDLSEATDELPGRALPPAPGLSREDPEDAQEPVELPGSAILDGSPIVPTFSGDLELSAVHVFDAAYAAAFEEEAVILEAAPEDAGPQDPLPDAGRPAAGGWRDADAVDEGASGRPPAGPAAEDPDEDAREGPRPRPDLADDLYLDEP